MFEFQNPNKEAAKFNTSTGADVENRPSDRPTSRFDFDGIDVDPVDQRDIEVLLDEVMEEALHNFVLGYCGGRDILTEVTDSATLALWEKFKSGEISSRRLLTAIEVLRRMFRNTEAKNDIIAG